MRTLRSECCGTANTDGALLLLNDSQGGPRIVLHVQRDDQAVIQIWDAEGNVVAQLPPSQDAGPATKPDLGAWAEARPTPRRRRSE